MNTNELRTKLAEINGDLVGLDLLDQLKAILITDPILASIFGNTGKRIFVNEKPKSYNDRNVPMLEMWWDNESLQSSDTYLTGTLGARIILPKQVMGKLDVQKMLFGAITRFMGSDHFLALYENVPGLTSLGANISAQFNKIIKLDQFIAPTIIFKIPYQFDLHLFKLAHPEIDLGDYLNSAPVEDFLTYIINVEDDSGNELTTWGDALKNDNNGA